MIDIESQVYTAVKNVVTASYPNCLCQSTLTLMPASFPTVCIEEVDNYVDPRGTDSANTEQLASVVYEVNIYSDAMSGRKAQAKAILKIIDDKMNDLGFIRRTRRPVSLDSAQVYRLVARYAAIVGRDEQIYGR